MKTCKTCGKGLTNKRNDYCNHSCAAKTTNLGVTHNPRKHWYSCTRCGRATNNPKFCSLTCQGTHIYETKVALWKQNKVSGVTPSGVVTKWLKKYLRTKYHNKCVLCGWSQVNPKTGIIPVVADHIDGNWQNNQEDNLRLLCPSCDSLQPTYCGANRGNGRAMRGKCADFV